MSNLQDLLGFDPDELEDLDDLPADAPERLRREYKATLDKLVEGLTTFAERIDSRMQELEQRFEDMKATNDRPINITVPQAPPAPVNVTVPAPKVEVKNEVKVPEQKQPRPEVHVEVPAPKQASRKLEVWKGEDGKWHGISEAVKE